MDLSKILEQEGFLGIVRHGKNTDNNREVALFDLEGIYYRIKLPGYSSNNDKLASKLRDLQDGTVVLAKGEIKGGCFYAIDLTENFEADHAFLGMPTLMQRLLEFTSFFDNEDAELPEYFNPLLGTESVSTTQLSDAFGVYPELIAAMANQEGLRFLSFDDPSFEKELVTYLQDKGFRYSKGKFMR